MAQQVEYLSSPIPVSMSDDWFEIAHPNHFWMEWRFEFSKKYLQSLPLVQERLLEIGCGNGVMRQQIESLGYTVDGCDLNEKALSTVKPGKGRVMVYNIFDRKPELIGQYGGVVLMDVIEHIDDDYTFLSAAIEHIRPGGYVIINVPANPYLFSKYDQEVGHQRRYTKESMQALFQGVGLQPVVMEYWGLSLIPIAIARKAMLYFSTESIVSKGFTPPGKTVHRLLKKIKNFEIKHIGSPIQGTSLFAIGKKTASYHQTLQ